MHTINYLSVNRPGPQMGMGHYERLLIDHLRKFADRRQWQFRMLFDGRAAKEPLSGTAAAVDRMAYLGFSSTRLKNVPHLVARGVMRLREGMVAGRSFYHALALTIPVPLGRPYVSTIHDLPPARFPDEGTLPGWAGRAAQESRAILTPSQFAKRELVELLGVKESRVHVVPNGCDHDRFHPGVQAASRQELDDLGLARPFVLYSGGVTRRKNVAALLMAWRQVATRFQGLSLGLAGPKHAFKEIREMTDTPRVKMVGYLNRGQMPAVMKAAEAVVVPSIYEGFGLPSLEAMAVGVPVVAVAAGATPEVVGDCAVLAPDGSPEAIGASLDRLLSDSSLAADLARRGPSRAALFLWDEHASQVLRVYEEAFC